MGKLRINTNLTMGHIAQNLSHTFEGQAHFGNSGPKNTFCAGCLSFLPTRNRSGTCATFTRLSNGKQGRVFPEMARSCRHFVDKTTVDAAAP